MACSRGLILMLAAIALALPPGSSDARTYRWVDEQGLVHYTDRLPPGQVDKGHLELNEQGLRVGEVPAAPTPEEVKREREIERLRAQQQRLIEQQNAADRALLRTYRSVDDLRMASNGKLAAIDALIGVARANVRRQQDWLRNLRTEAANRERAGKPVPAHLSDNMAQTERYIREGYAVIVSREQDKKQIHRDFDRDLKRFRQLSGLPEDGGESLPLSSPLVLNNLVACRGAEQCERYWARAVDYVREHATTQIQVSGDNLLMTAPPETNEDLSLTLSRVQEKDADLASLFLDSRCKNRGFEEATCKGNQADEVLEGFRRAVADPEGASGAPAPAPAQSTDPKTQ